MFSNYNKTISPNISQEIPIKKERLRVQLTTEER